MLQKVMEVKKLEYTLYLIVAKGSISLLVWVSQVTWEESVPLVQHLARVGVIEALDVLLPGVQKFIAAQLDLLLVVLQWSMPRHH